MIIKRNKYNLVIKVLLDYAREECALGGRVSILSAYITSLKYKLYLIVKTLNHNIVIFYHMHAVQLNEENKTIVILPLS